MYTHIKHFSKKDALDILVFNHETLQCSTEEEFKTHFLKLKRLIQFEVGSCVYVDTERVPSRGETTYDVLNINYPEEYLEHYLARRHDLRDQTTIEFLKTFRIQNWGDVVRYCLGGKKNEVVQDSESFGLIDGFAYGTRDRFSTYGTIFYWGGKSVENNQRTKTIIQLVTPGLSETLKQLIRQRKNKVEFCLTPREMEVLNWIKEGKSSWETSVILGVSENTVNYHIKNLKIKLNAANRPQIVTIAAANGLIE